MNAETIRRKTLSNQAWLERAILVLDSRDAWDAEDVKSNTGSYLANWIRTQRQKKVPLGQCLTTDQWVGRARYIVQKYTNDLLQLALEKAQRDYEYHSQKASECLARVATLRKEVNGIITPVAPVAPVAPVPVDVPKKPRTKTKRTKVKQR